MRGRIATPISGENSTATIQEMSRARMTTAKMAKEYSPAPLLANPTGTKPNAVTSVPVSMGKAVDV